MEEKLIIGQQRPKSFDFETLISIFDLKMMSLGEYYHRDTPPPDGTCSSVDLAPTLLTIYDNYATDDQSDTATTETCDNRVINRENSQQQANNSKNVTEIGTIAMETNSNTDTGDTHGIQHMDGPPSSLNPNNDAKKRPLSISSTSSSTSSTSSLPRHQRKKIAGGTTLGFPPSPLHGYHHETSSITHSVHTDIQELPAGVMSLDSNMSEDEEPEESMCKRISKNDSVESTLEKSKYSSALNQSKGEEITLKNSPKLRKSIDLGNCERKSPAGSPKVRKTYEHGLTYIDKVVAEIVETERTYVRDLNVIIEGYFAHIRDHPEVCLTPDDLGALFGNIEEIFDFNREFLEAIENCEADPLQIAQCFVDKNEGFVIYADYCTNYPRSVEVLTSCMRDPHTSEVFKLQQVALKHSLPLGSYLLKPVQRILKYHLLLQNIVNNYGRTKPGHSVVEMALASMTNMAQHINEMKRKHEHAVRIQEIQSVLHEWEGADLTTFGDLVLEDSFRVCGAKGHRQIFLFEKGLLIAKKKEDGSLLIKSSIMCSNLMLIESIPKEPLSFHVIPFDNPKMQFTLQARNMEHKRKWCLEIKRLMLENYTAVIPDKAKELVMKLGKSREEEDYEDSFREKVDSPRKQHSVPEYLQRRKTRRKSTSIIPDFGLLRTHKGKKGHRRADTTSPKPSPQNRRRSLTETAKEDTISTSSRETNTREEVVFRKMTAGKRNAAKRLSRSLESLNDLSSDTTESSSKRESFVDSDVGATSFDDASDRAKRMSLIMNQAEECLLTPFENDQVTSLVNLSPVSRNESFKAATELHRLDSKFMDESKREKYKTEMGAKYSDLSTIADKLKALDDGYVSIKITDDKIQIVENKNSEPIKTENCQPNSFGEHIDFGSIEMIDSDNTNNNLMEDSTNVEISNTNSEEHKSGASCSQTVDNSKSSFDNTQLLEAIDETDIYKTQSKASSLESCDDVLLRSHKNRSPAKMRHSTSSQNSALTDSYLSSSSRSTSDHTLTAASVYSHGSSVTLCSAGKSGVKDPENDPWILRRDIEETYFIHEQPDIHHKCRIPRSNSFTSIEDLTAQIEKKSQKKPPSDTLVFSNRNAFFASFSPRIIRRKKSVDRTVARLATPPREFGPVDMIREIEDCKEQERIFTRYATPPRTLEDDSKEKDLDISDSLLNELDKADKVDPIVRKKSATVPMRMGRAPAGNAGRGDRPVTIASDGPSRTGLWSELEQYAQNNPNASKRSFRFPLLPSRRSESFRTARESPLSSESQSPSVSSPAQTNDSFVDSLKHAVFNITSKMKMNGRAGSRSVGSSPLRSPHTKSVSAIEQIDQDENMEKSSARKDTRKKRSQIISNFAKAYGDKSRPKKPKDNKAVAKQLTSFLKENIHGSSRIGARIASSKPVVLGTTYTLPRHRPPRPKRSPGSQGDSPPGNGSSSSAPVSREGTPESESQMQEKKDTREGISYGGEALLNRQLSTMDDPSNSGYDSGCIEDVFKDEDQTLGHILLLKNLKLPLDQIETSGSDDQSLTDCYYEERLVEDLEECMNDEFRDSAVYSDDGTLMNEGEQSGQKVTIRETVKLIEQKWQRKTIPKYEIKRKEKGTGIREILKNLEASNTTGVKSDNETSPNEKTQVKSIRERARELEECATMTRIRQNSLQVTDDYLSPSGDEECSDGSVVGSPAKKGWVKQVVSLLESESTC